MVWLSTLEYHFYKRKAIGTFRPSRLLIKPTLPKEQKHKKLINMSTVFSTPRELRIALKFAASVTLSEFIGLRLAFLKVKNNLTLISFSIVHGLFSLIKSSKNN